MSDKNKVTIEFKNKRDLYIALFQVGLIFHLTIDMLKKVLSKIDVNENAMVSMFGIVLIGLGGYGIVSRKILIYDKSTSRIFNIVVNGLIVLFGISYIVLINF